MKLKKVPYKTDQDNPVVKAYVAAVKKGMSKTKNDREGLLKHLIEVACERGWRPKIQYRLNPEFYQTHILFDHEFNRCLWGETDYWYESECTWGGAILPIVDQHYEHCKRLKAKRDWKFHIQRLALAEDRLGYFRGNTECVMKSNSCIRYGGEGC